MREENGERRVMGRGERDRGERRVGRRGQRTEERAGSSDQSSRPTSGPSTMNPIANPSRRSPMHLQGGRPEVIAATWR